MKVEKKTAFAQLPLLANGTKNVEHTAAHTVPSSDLQEFIEGQSLSFRLGIMSFGADTAQGALHLYFRNFSFGGIASTHSKIVLLHLTQFDLHFRG